jgi:hypothetical protein
MTPLDVSRCTLGLYAAFVVAGCGVMRNQTVVPRSPSAVTTHARSADKGTILFDAIYGDGGRGYMYTYPGGQFIRTIGAAGNGYCNGGPSGDAWIASGGQQVYQIEPDGSIGTIIQDLYQPTWGCAVDRKTGTLAVTSRNGQVALFAGAHGDGTPYTTGLGAAYYCTYDSNDDLFVDGTLRGSSGAVAELPSGGKTFQLIQLNKPIDGFWAIQWDGKFLAVEATQGAGKITIYRFSVAGSIGKVVATTHLLTQYKLSSRESAEFWIRGTRILEGTNNQGTFYDSYLQFWRYPAGGNPIKTVEVPPKIGGLTVIGGDPR